jgi:hypothetical protein
MTATDIEMRRLSPVSLRVPDVLLASPYLR